jgi:uncharacterized surface protein with fasciclin (FAS1) repeats
MRRILSAAVAAVAIVSLGAAAPALAQDEEKNIVEIASGNEDFETLVKAVTAAELAETLSGEGPFTVFAPTDAAFDALPEGTLDTLLKDPKGALADILKLHVLSGAVDSKAAIAAAGGTVETLGGPVAIELDGDTLMVGGAKVVTADLKASNGVIHVIDAVITKPAAEAPASVETGDSGLAANDAGTSPLLIAFGALAVGGIAISSLRLARNKR